MNSTAKTILSWILILGAAVALYSFVERGTGGSPTKLTLTDLMNKLQADQVKDVTINGSNLSGHLKANPTEEFSSVIPQDYSTIYDKLTSKSVEVTIIPPKTNPLLGVVPTSLLIGGSILWFAISVVVLVLVVDLSRFVKRELGRSGSRPSTS